MLPQLESGKVTMLEDIYLNLTHHTYQTPPQSSVGESSSLIWLVLFSTVIVLSLFVNTIFFAAVVSTRKMSKIHLFLFLFFIINLLEYSLLIFEFSLGTGNHYPYSDGSCSVYQMLLQGNPLLSAGALILLVYHAYSATFLSQPRLILLLSLIIFTQLLLSIPSFLYSGLAVYPSGARYCVMDLGGVSSWAGMPMERQQMATALYYLMYKPILTYWLPICLLTAPLVKMGKLVNTTMDDQFNITLTITITISYGVFHLPRATTMFVRYVPWLNLQPTRYDPQAISGYSMSS